MTRVSFGLREPDGGGSARRGCTASAPNCAAASAAASGIDDRIAAPATDSEGGVVVEVEYLIEVLDRALVGQLLRHYGVLLDDALAQPDGILPICGLMSDADVDWLGRCVSG